MRPALNSRRGRALALGLAAAWLAAPARATLDDFYYNYDEIHAELTALAAQYPGWIRVDSLGYSYATHTPIWGAKISDNAQVEEDEPAIWISGQCHAEEILGVSISMEFIRRLLQYGSAGHPVWTPLLESLEIHVVPSYNPDGLDVVMSGADHTYRKNTHPMNADGLCHIDPIVGGDSCGVDLNRNYPVWWAHGDTLWEQTSDFEQYDYFRGPGALSEPECQAIARQAERERFVATVAYHSARTSTNHEIVIYPWSWEGAYTCPGPDFTMMEALSGAMAGQIATVDQSNGLVYRHVAGDGRKGNQHNWIYSRYGAVGLLIEVGTQGDAGMQPQNQEAIDFVVDENIDGLVWLCRRVIGYEVAAPGLVTHVVDAQDGHPLAARLRMEEVMHADCVPWYRTDPQFGVYYRLLNPQTYAVKVRKHGYQALDTTVVVGNSLPTRRTWALQELPRHALSLGFQAREDGAPLLASRVELRDLAADTLLAWDNPGAFSASLPQGAYELTAWLPGRVPVSQTLLLDGDQQPSFIAAEAENGVGSFTHEFTELSEFVQTGLQCGWNQAWNDSLQAHFQDAPGHFSPPGENCRLASAQGWLLDVPVRDTIPGALEFVEFHALEGGRDSAFVEFSPDDGVTWSTVLVLTGDGGRITRRSVPIGLEWASSAFRFAFRVKTNGILEDSGLHLRDIRLSWNGRAVALDPPAWPEDFALAAWPNPFNPAATLRLTLPALAAGARADLALYDILGREVLRLPGGDNLAAGGHEFRLDGSALASGVYFARAVVERDGRELWRGVRRLTLLR